MFQGYVGKFFDKYLVSVVVLEIGVWADSFVVRKF